MTVKILGTGCAKCKRLEEKVKAVIIMNSIDASVEKVTDLDEIMKFNIMRTPGLVINEKMISSGVIPKDEQILQWLREG
jgi:small redox-active disulfide protein 2